MKNPVKRLIGILLVALILVSYSNSPLARHSVLSFVIRGNWTKGINLFSGIAVVVTFCIEYLAYLTLKMITLSAIMRSGASSITASRPPSARSNSTCLSRYLLKRSGSSLTKNSPRSKR